jgi:beta-galactosidase
MGCNAIRTAHNIPDRTFLELCDELGLVVINEAFDVWFSKKRWGDWGGRPFRKLWAQELTAFIRRDRNHPSVVLWSMGNEVRGMASKSNKQQYLKMRDLTKFLDPTRPVTVVLSPNEARLELQATEKHKKLLLGDLTDVLCMNYFEHRMHEFHARWPEKAIIIAEAHHYYRTRRPDEVDLPKSDRYPGDTTRNPWYDIALNEYAIGQFLWVGIEYFGEVHDPYPFHGRTNAPLRINGFHKPQAGFHSSVWLDRPYIHLAVHDESVDIPRGKPHFDFPKIVCHWNFEDYPQPYSAEIWTFTNCDTVELQLNGVSLGEKAAVDYPFNTMTWSVPYASGTLVAIGKNFGQEVTRTQLITAGIPVRINALSDVSELKADGYDCANIEIELVDAQGVLVSRDDRLITIDISGEGRLKGIDSGDLSKFLEAGAYQHPQCRTYWGQALAVVQSTKKPGRIFIWIKSDGLESAEIIIQTKS